MKLRFIAVFLATGIFWLSSWLIAPSAAAMTSIKLSNLSYELCQGSEADEAAGSVSSGNLGAANCYSIKGKAKNISGKTVVDADVFGRIYDANDNDTFENRGRIGTIEEVPPGTSDFEIRVSIPANQPTPLKLKNFKASGFAGRVRPYYYDDFEYEN
ncbi:MAG: hypothetical protein AAFQ41_13970 [Cyanobacteria bacterium J06623_7]